MANAAPSLRLWRPVLNRPPGCPVPLVLLNKPFRVLSQFSGGDGRATLADFVSVADVYPAGRLDLDSEGLLLLTDDGRLKHRLAHPRSRTEKTYWVQVEGVPVVAALTRLRAGVQLRDGPARPCRVCAIAEPARLWPREPPVRFRRSVPTTWLALTLSEGRNRQVRRMTAAVGLPTLRLIRVRIGGYRLGELAPGVWRRVA